MGPHDQRQVVETRIRIESLLRYYEAQNGEYAAFIAILQERLHELPPCSPGSSNERVRPS